MDQIQQIKNENDMEAMDNKRLLQKQQQGHFRQGSQVSIGQKPPLAKNASIESTIGDGGKSGKNKEVFDDLMGSK